MKKAIVILVFLSLSPHTAWAQITLSQSSYPSTIVGKDSLKYTTSGSAFPLLPATSGGLWDMSIVTDSTLLGFCNHLESASYEYADSNMYWIGDFPYQGNAQKSITDSGLYEFGQTINLVKYDLTSLTAGASDTLIIPFQNVIYSTPLSLISFPATYHSSWMSSNVSDVNFQLTVLPTYDHSTGILRKYITNTNSVIGWGKMRINDGTGNPTAFFDILQVKVETHSIDSIFINGFPAAPIALLILTTAQGQRDSVYEQNYYRMEEVTPLAKVTFRDATYTQPLRAVTHVQRLIRVEVPTVSGQEEVQVFPVPVDKGVIKIKYPPTVADVNFTLYDLLGVARLSGTLPNTGSSTSIRLPDEITSGVYFLRIMDQNGKVSFRSISVIR